jgi:clusterin-associated protein 1
LDSFRTPNFELVADILCYLVQLVDSTIPIHDGIGTAADRVQFLNGITVELASRLNLSLDGRKLYSADGYAVQELHKLAQLIQRALALADDASCSSDADPVSTASRSAQEARAMANEIAEMGEKIQNLLKHEASDRDYRAKAIKSVNSAAGADDLGAGKSSIEEIITQILNETNDAVERLDKQCKMLMSNKKGMEEKIRKRSIDLERNTKRLESLTLQNVRPAFMDEYEQIEMELEVEYERYVVRFRNVDYLERELRSRRASSRKSDDAERSVKRRQKKFREEELRILEGSDDSDNVEAKREQSAKSRGKENSRPRDNAA